jgi:hypothetical protein
MLPRFTRFTQRSQRTQSVFTVFVIPNSFRDNTLPLVCCPETQWPEVKQVQDDEEN